MSNRLRMLLTLLSSLLLISSLFVPWWTATARLPAGNARAELTLYSFQFESASFSCTTILMFYSYGACPLLGNETGVATLSFYLFWSLVFLLLAFSLGIASLYLTLKGHASQVLWLPLVLPVLGVVNNLSFVAAISTAGLKFVTGTALYGSSEVLSWAVSTGFVLAIASTLIQLVTAYVARNTV